MVSINRILVIAIRENIKKNAANFRSSITIVTEEVKRPEVNIPRSIAISVPIVTVLYVFMNIAYMTVLNIPEMISSTAVAVAFGERTLGYFAFLIPLGVALATFGCALSVQFGVTR